VWKLAGKSKGPRVEALRKGLLALVQMKAPYDLVAKSDEEMRKIRGNKIAMIFQEPMQALNPVFPIGTQIAENILLHQRQAVVKGLVEKMDVEIERDAIGRELRALDPDAGAAPAPLPKPPPRPRSALLLGGAWIAISLLVAGASAFLLGGLLGGAFPGLEPPQLRTLTTAFALAIASSAAAIGCGAGIVQSAPWSRHAGVVLAVLEILSRLFLLALPVPSLFRLLIVAGILVDVFILHRLTIPEAAAAMTGRRKGWEALLHAAEGDADKLTDVRDLIASSRLDPPARDKIVARLDRLIARARNVLDLDEPISGHFYPLLPRRFQLTYHRRAWKDPNRDVIRQWSEVPVVGGLVEFLGRPLILPVQGESIRAAVRMLRRVKISDPERIANQYPHELSGGMQQRALIAIALSCNPRLLIADEPTTALDVTIQAQILELIKEMKTTFGSTVLLITHDLGIIAEMCSRVCVMYAGSVIEDATVRAVFKAPFHPYTQGLMKAIPSHTVRKDRLEIIRGSVPNLITPPPGCRFHPRCPAVFEECGWSPTEVGDEIRAVIREQGWPIDAEAITIQPEGSTELRIRFPEGTAAREAVEWTRRAVEAGRSRPAIGAVVSVEPAGPGAAEGKEPYDVVVRILEPRKPPAFEVEPRHFAACLLYEKPLVTAVAGGGSRG
jgi:oligopeptide/dipeptide ABC transporter ATP-binding protein